MTVRKASLTTAWIDFVSWIVFHVPEFRGLESRGLRGPFEGWRSKEEGSVSDRARCSTLSPVLEARALCSAGLAR